MSKFFLIPICSVLAMYLIFLISFYWEHREKKGGDRMGLINKAKIKAFIKEHGKHITQVEETFYTALETRIEKMILHAISNNASRRRLTQYELLGNGQPKEVSNGNRAL
jgi:hypothetical protein